MECDGDDGKAEREEADVCGRFPEQRTVDFNGVSVAVHNPSRKEIHVTQCPVDHFPGRGERKKTLKFSSQYKRSDLLGM